MMLPIPTWRLLKDLWPVLVLLIAGGAIMVAGALFAVRGCSTEPPEDGLLVARDQILDQVRREREENAKKLEVLGQQLDSLRFQVDQLDLEIANSAREREEIHDAIDNATSIGDVDSALKRGGRVGRRGR